MERFANGARPTSGIEQRPSRRKQRRARINDIGVVRQFSYDKKRVNKPFVILRVLCVIVNGPGNVRAGFG